MNYYNEIDGKAAAWLRELIAANLIPPGHVDERSICDVTPSDLSGFVQCHFFAGVAGWPLALQLAGYPPHEPIWTGSCPCQPFSAAGQQKGEADERHLWPELRRLIAECNPPVVFGEQVASKLGREWLAGIRTDLEGMAYAVGAADLCSAGVGSPNIRQRLYWVANSASKGPLSSAHFGVYRGQESGGSRDGEPQRCGCAGGLALAGPQPAQRELQRPGEGAGEAEQRASDQLGGSSSFGRPADAKLPERREVIAEHECDGSNARRDEAPSRIGACGEVVRLEHAESDGRQQRRPESIGRGIASGCGASGMADADGGQCRDGELQSSREHGQQPKDCCSTGGMGDANSAGPQPGRQTAETARHGSATLANGSPGFWSNFDIIPCADGKARRVESGTFPLAHGVSGRVGLLRGYGNAICPQVAAEFIKAFLEIE